MTSTPDCTAFPASAGMGPVPATGFNRWLAPVADGELAVPAAPLVFSEFLGLCSPEKEGTAATDPEEPALDTRVQSSPQNRSDGQGSELPFFWTPFSQFAPPPPAMTPPPSLLPVETAASGENALLAGDEGGGVFSSPDALEFRPPAVGNGSTQRDLEEAQPVSAAGVSEEAPLPAKSLPAGKPFEANFAKVANVGVAFSGLDQARATPGAAPDITAKAGGEFIATTGAAGRFAVAQAQVFENKNIGKSIDVKKLEKIENQHGIGSAIGVGLMPLVPVTSQPVDPALTPAPSASVAGELASAAVRMVERVAEVAELVRDTPAERVTLKLDLDDTHRVEVRVLLREGRVHTEFRSDSPEVRSALSSAWADFSAKREAGSPLWAEPVFAAMGPAVPSSAPTEPVRLPVLASPAPAKGFAPDQPPGQGGSGRQAQREPEPRGSKGGSAVVPVASVSGPNPTTPVRDRHRLLSVHA